MTDRAPDAREPYGFSTIPSRARAGLDRRQRRAAFWAGFVGFNLMALGAGLVLVVLLIAGISALIGDSLRPASEAGRPFPGDDLWLWIGGIALGLVALAVGVLTSVGIMRRGGMRRPSAVTWSAFGISLPALVVVQVVVSSVAASFGQSTGLIPGVGLGVVIVVVSSLLAGAPDVGTAGVLIAVAGGSILLTGVIGGLVWWWMAHVQRLRLASPASDEAMSGEVT